LKNFKALIEAFYNWGSNDLSNSNLFTNLSSIKINPFTLSFPERLESGFLEHYYKTSNLQINISLVVGAILFSIFFFFDLYIIPNKFINLILSRVVISWIILILTFSLINKAKNKKILQPIISLATVLIVINEIIFNAVIHFKQDTYFYVAIILLYFWVYAFLKLRFLWATFAGVTIFLIYFFSELNLLSTDPNLFYISTTYLLASNLAGIVISYTQEYNSRKDFFQNLVLKRSLETNLGLNKRISENEKTIGKAEEKLMLLSKALETAANSILILNNKGNIIFANTAFSDLTGYTNSELIGKNPRIIKSGKHDELFYKNLWSTILKGNVWTGDIINKKKSGDLYYEEMTITPVSNNGSKEISHFIAIKQDITHRKQMEDKLLESEKRFRSLFENAVMGIYKSTPSGDILMANDALIKMLGFETFEELKNWRNINAGYSNPNQRDEFMRLIKENGRIIGFESEWIKKDGTKIYIRESARKIIEFGQTVYEGTVEDITFNKLAQVEVNASKERLQKVFDNVYDGIFVHDIEGNIVDINNKVLDLYNVSREDILKLKIRDISSEENPIDTVATIWQDIIYKEKTFLFEWKALRPNDKSVFDVEVFLSKIHLDEKEYILANVRDITEKKEATKKLLLTQRAVDLNASPIYWISDQAKFIYANNAALQQSGYSLNELLNMNVFDTDVYWTEEYWKDVEYPTLKKLGVSQFESVNKRKNGELYPVEVNASLITFDNEDIVIAIVNDITERKKIAEKIIEAKNRAEKSDKLKSDFLAGMSHEIRTPVNTILNFISLIKSDLGENISGDIASSFEMIDNGSRRLIRTIDSIINMSQLQSGAYDIHNETFSLIEDILHPIYNEFKHSADLKHLEFNLIHEPINSKIFGDQYTITQLFVNLIDNAIKYTKRGRVEISVCSEENMLITKIIDSGIGISEEFLPTLFEPFSQEEMGYTRSFEGNGLGLALVKKYVEINNGTIQVKSKKDQGTTFIIKLKKTES